MTPRPKSKRKTVKHVTKDERVGNLRTRMLEKRVEAQKSEINAKAAELAIADPERVGSEEAWETAKDTAEQSKADAERLAESNKGRRDVFHGKAPSKREQDAERRDELRKLKADLDSFISSGYRMLEAHHEMIDTGEGDPTVFQQAVERGLDRDKARQVALEKADLDAYTWERGLEAAEQKLAEIEPELAKLNGTP